MSGDKEATLATAQIALLGELKDNWGWLLALGILSTLLGILGFYLTFAFTLASVLLFGFLILAGGVLQLIHAFNCKGWKSAFSHGLIALLYVMAGILIMLDPVLVSSLFTLMLGGILIAAGTLRILMAFQHRRVADAWYWPVLSGVVSMLLGGMIIAQWPLSGLWVIGLFVAIELLINGWTLIFVALAARKATQAEAAPSL